MNISKASKCLLKDIPISRVSWNDTKYLIQSKNSKLVIVDNLTGKSKTYNPTLEDLNADDWKKFETKISQKMSFKEAMMKLLNGECTNIFKLKWLKTRETCYVYAKKNSLYFSWMGVDDVTRYASPFFSPENGISDHEIYFEEDWVCNSDKLPKRIVVLPR